MTQVLSLGAHSSAIWAGLIVLLLTASNLLGIQASSRLQSVLLAVAIMGLLVLAMVLVLLTFGGWGRRAGLGPSSAHQEVSS